jgi:hypothetical protein
MTIPPAARWASTSARNRAVEAVSNAAVGSSSSQIGRGATNKPGERHAPFLPLAEDRRRQIDDMANAQLIERLSDTTPFSPPK